MLLSRVADALYWISRYLERAEHTARVVKVRLDLDLDRHGREIELILRDERGGTIFEMGLRLSDLTAR